MKIGFFGDGPWSHSALKILINDPGIEIKFVCARFDNPDGELLKIADEFGIIFFTHHNVNSPDFIEYVQEFNCDLFVSMSFNQIFKEEIIGLVPESIINCHAGKLPKYRGRNILNWALINDEKEFGITVHYVDTGIDTGDIIFQEVFPITDEDNYATLLDKSFSECPKILYKAIKAIQSQEVIRIKQESLGSLGMYCVARKNGDEKLDWEKSTREIFNFVRALCEPGPNARTFLGSQEIEIKRASQILNCSHYIGIPGAIVGVTPDYFDVKTGDSVIRIIEWRGYEKPRIGDRLK
jgi:methionyl-tRNA formyltransferase